MQSAARTHWRAAAWLLEREDPETYGRRSASSCSPFRLDEALRTVMEAALEATEPGQRAAVYAHMQAASETAFKRAFPTYGPSGRRMLLAQAATPLSDAELRKQYEDITSPHNIHDYHEESAINEHDNQQQAEPEALARAPKPPAESQPSRVGASHPPSKPAAHGPVQSTSLPPQHANDEESTDPTPPPVPTLPPVRLSYRYPLRAAATLNSLHPHIPTASDSINSAPRSPHSPHFPDAG